eukprot:TRINITY_DN12441_c0_g3_i3.p1 TRINITY_DN12441_c0_g3~~TRINITY_DN12441_c0_g3_i3.p1  ORF type:complete len:891 (+),score=141.34 TRINITY_DN12441_c0_g3_i3:857-3529(+)
MACQLESPPDTPKAAHPFDVIDLEATLVPALANEIDDGGDNLSEADASDQDQYDDDDEASTNDGAHCHQQRTLPALIPSPFCTRAPVLRFVYSGDGEQTEPLPRELTLGLKWKLQATTPNLVKKMVRTAGFQITTKNGWIGTWGKHMKATSFQRLRPDQKINHFPGSFQLGRKDRMWKNIAHMQARYGRANFDFVPETFCLPSDMHLLKRAWDAAGSRGKWILKPNASARGIGIKVIHQWAQVPKKKSVIVQRYLCNPLLINDTKFDLRIYAYVTSFDPLRVYICKDGLARFATQKYSNKRSKLKNRYMHLTNYSINKKAAEFVSNADKDECVGHKWGLQALLRHLEDQGIDTQLVWHRICDIVVKTLMAVESTINSGVKWNCKSRSVCHELFGFDVMLEADLKPYLIEVNISPSMASSSQLDRDIKGRLLRDVFNIAGYMPPVCRTAGCQGTPPSDGVAQDKGSRGYSAHLNQNERLKHAHYIQQYDDLRMEGNLKDILTQLTDDDICMLMETEEEHARCGDMIRLIPSVEYSPLLKYTQTPRYYNILVSEWAKRYKHAPAKGLELLQSIAVSAQDRHQHGKPAPSIVRQGHAKCFLSADQFYRAPDRARPRVLSALAATPIANTLLDADGSLFSDESLEPLPASVLDGRQSQVENEDACILRVLTAGRGDASVSDDGDDGEGLSYTSDDSSMEEEIESRPGTAGRYVPSPPIGKPIRSRPLLRRLDAVKPNDRGLDTRGNIQPLRSRLLRSVASDGEVADMSEEGWVSSASSASSTKSTILASLLSASGSRASSTTRSESIGKQATLRPRASLDRPSASTAASRKARVLPRSTSAGTSRVSHRIASTRLLAATRRSVSYRQHPGDDRSSSASTTASSHHFNLSSSAFG